MDQAGNACEKEFKAKFTLILSTGVERNAEDGQAFRFQQKELAKERHENCLAQLASHNQ